MISERKIQERREKHEFEAWKIAWLTSPHVKEPIDVKKIYDYDKQKELSEKTTEEEFDDFDKMFMNSEDKKARQKEEIANALRRINAKAEEEKKNGN